MCIYIYIYVYIYIEVLLCSIKLYFFALNHYKRNATTTNFFTNIEVALITTTICKKICRSSIFLILKAIKKIINLKFKTKYISPKN